MRRLSRCDETRPRFFMHDRMSRIISVDFRRVETPGYPSPSGESVMEVKTQAEGKRVLFKDLLDRLIEILHRLPGSRVQKLG